MGIVAILAKNIRWRFHNSFTIVVTILQPILWLVLYSTVAGKTMEGSRIENYTAFIFPGLIVLICFSTCSSSGMMNYMMKSEGSFYRILIAPIKRSSIILGQVLESVCCTFLEVGVMGIVGLFFSVRLFPSIGSAFIVILLVFFTSFFVASIAYGVSLILPNEMIYETVMSAIVLPIFFLSSALFPIEELTGMLRIVVYLNPFTYVINSLRSTMLYQTGYQQEIFYSIILLFILSLFAFLFANRQLKRETNL
ncbi:ABC transporter permease [Enterococcus hulanensis]|uniref:ABC transporter permease n=1 Tax=Enterococcus hulanensis TaxID=2559929 RepID=UPI001A9039F6|nr:ABC transporter permease [Enterococcus hulanensis]MBO0459406.1 ABC transporter permease [Enterococcus hulanensis]